MKLIIHKITGWLAKLSQYLVSFGPFGLIAIAFLDSVLVPMPGGVDAVLLVLAASRPSWMLIYVAAATIGSTIGCIGLYRISQRAGKRALARFSESKQKRVKELIDRYDVLSVMIASVLPPPFPFKLFVVSAGVFRLNLVRFTLAIGGGRLFRYLLEGYLAAHYGEHAKELLARYYPTIGIVLAALIIAGFVARAFLRRDTTSRPLSDVESQLRIHDWSRGLMMMKGARLAQGVYALVAELVDQVEEDSKCGASVARGSVTLNDLESKMLCQRIKVVSGGISNYAARQFDCAQLRISHSSPGKNSADLVIQ